MGKVIRMEKKQFSMRAAPALEEYITRVNAEQLNFRRFMVKEHKGHYYTEKVLIRIKPDGSVECNSKDHAPTKEEFEAIKAELSKLEFPTAIHASKVQLKKLINSLKNATEEDFFSFLDKSRKNIVMAQQRIQNEDGTKKYIPWTLWSDGEWRAMEPEGALPFWKPPEKRHERIMIHEGAKSAAVATEIALDKKSSHPWYELLKDYDHWGMIGGALAPHRADYDEIRAEKPTEVIYVCDNDWPGQHALELVSRFYGGSMKGIRFDQRWPAGWDIADPMPERFFKELKKGERRYIGPQLKELMKPATRATELVSNKDSKGRSAAVATRTFREEWVHAVQPEVFIHRDWPNRIFTAPEFNNFVSPYSDVDDTARILKKDDTSKGATLRYVPGEKSGLYGSGENGRFINTHCPSNIKPEKRDVSMFLDFMEHLIPIESDRFETLRWCATLLACPSVKMHYGLLLISESQGVGKTTLGEKILAPIVGMLNVSFPPENEIVDSQYNYWIAHKRLAVIHEIYAGHSSKAYDRLKSVITDKNITVSKKYQANYEIDNWIHVFACSNSLRAIKLSFDDRRWFVPKVTERVKDTAYWTELNEWLETEGGLQAILYWSKEFIKKVSPVLPSQSSPDSSTKREVIEDSYSPGMILVMDLLDSLKEEHGDSTVWFTDAALVRFIQNELYEGRHNERLEKPLTMRKLAKSKGWFIGEERMRHGEALGDNPPGRVITNNVELALTDPANIKGIYGKACSLVKSSRM
jgi:hypothetical protein